MTCSFTLKHYFETLERATQELGYVTAPISRTFEMRNEGTSRFILLRHDVDLSLDWALKMAKEEAERGYFSTYYILLHAPTYNVLSPKGTSTIQEISKLGHEIGLHLDTKYQIPDEHLILQDIIGTGKKIETYTHHYPSLRENDSLPNLMNAMVLRNYEIKYISESGRHWREGCFCKHLDTVDRLQVLTHPIWWVTDSKNREDAVKKLHYNVMFNALDGVHDYTKVLNEYITNEIGIKQ
jgi:hypothetical protein